MHTFAIFFVKLFAVQDILIELDMIHIDTFDACYSYHAICSNIPLLHEMLFSKFCTVPIFLIVAFVTLALSYYRTCSKKMHFLKMLFVNFFTIQSIFDGIECDIG